MITETRQAEGLTLQLIFQTQLLKVVFTTLYVDVKEPAAPHTSAHKKTQPCLPTRNVSVNSRDKIEHQFAVPKCARTQLRPAFAIGSPASGGVNKLAIESGSSTREAHFF